MTGLEHLDRFHDMSNVSGSANVGEKRIVGEGDLVGMSEAPLCLWMAG